MFELSSILPLIWGSEIRCFRLHLYFSGLLNIIIAIFYLEFESCILTQRRESKKSSILLTTS